VANHEAIVRQKLLIIGKLGEAEIRDQRKENKRLTGRGWGCLGGGGLDTVWGGARRPRRQEKPGERSGCPRFTRFPFRLAAIARPRTVDLRGIAITTIETYAYHPARPEGSRSLSETLDRMLGSPSLVFGMRLISD
jgi:hypothetical protein